MLDNPTISTAQVQEAQAFEMGLDSAAAAQSQIRKAIFDFSISTPSYGVVNMSALSAFREEMPFTPGKAMVSNNQFAGAIMDLANHAIAQILWHRLEGLMEYEADSDLDAIVVLEDLKEEIKDAAAFSSSFSLRRYVDMSEDRPKIQQLELHKTMQTLCDIVKNRMMNAPAIPTIDTNLGEDLHEIFDRNYQSTHEDHPDANAYEAIRTEAQAAQEQSDQL